MSAVESNGAAAGVDAKRLGQAESGDSSLARLASLREGDTVRVQLQRFDPSRDEAPYMESYEVPYTKLMRVLDVLNYIAEDLEEDLAYRWYCGVKKCGTCAVRVNGREVLSCWEAAEPDMVIEPLRHAPVIRDTVVDRAPYEERIKRMTPWLERAEPYPGFPERLSHRDMGGVVHALNCLSCMCCPVGVPGPRPRRRDEFRRPGTARPVRPAGPRPAGLHGPRPHRPRGGFHLRLRVVLPVRGGLPGRHPHRQRHY